MHKPDQTEAKDPRPDHAYVVSVDLMQQVYQTLAGLPYGQVAPLLKQIEAMRPGPVVRHE